MPTSLYVLAPSFFCLVINGFLLFILLLMVIFNFRSLIKADYIKLLPIIGTVAIAIGMHGLLHLGLEQAYNYNPIYLLFN
jgi:hypothetical protein